MSAAQAARQDDITARAKAENTVLMIKAGGLIGQLRQIAQSTPQPQPTFGTWLDAAGVTSADAETWTGGAVKAESWAHIHHHFVQVQDSTSQLEEQLRKTETQAAELEKERARLATLLQAHEEKTTCTKECST